MGALNTRVFVVGVVKFGPLLFTYSAVSRCVLKQRLLSGGSLAETNKTLADSYELQKTHIPDCDEIQKKPLAPKRYERVFMKGGEGKNDFRSLSQKSCGGVS